MGSEDNFLFNNMFKYFYNLHPIPLDRLKFMRNFNITRLKFFEVLFSVQRFLSKLEFEILGLSSGKEVSLERADKFFLINSKGYQQCTIKNDVEDYEIFQQKVLVFSVIKMEGGKILYEKFVDMVKNFVEPEFVIYLKNENYLTARVDKEERNIYIEFHWRFHAEFPGFDPNFESIFE